MRAPLCNIPIRGHQRQVRKGRAGVCSTCTCRPCITHGTVLLTRIYALIACFRSLLAVIVALGLVSAVAFSASYQLVARFANKASSMQKTCCLQIGNPPPCKSYEASPAFHRLLPAACMPQCWAHADCVNSALQSVVALGLGCVGSGLVVLVLETLIGVGSAPTRAQLIWLFELTAGARYIPHSAQSSSLHAAPPRPPPSGLSFYSAKGARQLPY